MRNLTKDEMQDALHTILDELGVFQTRAMLDRLVKERWIRHKVQHEGMTAKDAEEWWNEIQAKEVK